MRRIPICTLASRRLLQHALINNGVKLCDRRPVHKCPHRLVVRTSRRGRDNPGSTPGVDIYVCLNVPLLRNQCCLHWLLPWLIGAAKPHLLPQVAKRTQKPLQRQCAWREASWFLFEAVSIQNGSASRYCQKKFAAAHASIHVLLCSKAIC